MRGYPQFSCWISIELEHKQLGFDCYSPPALSLQCFKQCYINQLSNIVMVEGKEVEGSKKFCSSERKGRCSKYCTNKVQLC